MQRLLHGLTIIVLMTVLGCIGLETRDPVITEAPPVQLKSIRYTIQVGAFFVPSNAHRLLNRLRSQGLDAYHFIDTDGLYRVRFGDYPSRSQAESRAQSLKKQQVISDFFIVAPKFKIEPHTRREETTLREALVTTAQRFLGVDYQWGGTDPDTGFDCSGLLMTVYKLNGLNLPRTSREQYRSGKNVKKDALRPGDLVFFNAGGADQVSHVGLYAGENRFIHAPGTNKPVRYAHLSDRYFKERFVGARTYLGY